MKKSKTIVRTMLLPIAEILDGKTKQHFYRDLRFTLSQCRIAYNYSISLCAINEYKTNAEAMIKNNKISKGLKTYNYGKIAHLFPNNRGVAASIDKMATSKYRSERFNFLRGVRSLPVQRSCPMPLLHNKGAKQFILDIDNDGNIIATLKLLDGNKYCVRLRGGSNYKYILDRVKYCIEQDLIGDSKIWINKKGVATIGIACRITPKQNTQTVSKKINVVLNRDVFVSVIKPHSKTPFNITGDQVKKWQSERKRRQERFRQDRKSGVARKTLTNIQKKISIKYNNRLKTFVHQTTSQIVKHAIRNKTTILEYNATIRSYFGGDFPYFEFAKTLEDKCILNGIEFVKVTQDVVPADLDEPHVYFMMSIVNGKPDGKIKIGQTSQKKGKRKRGLETAGGFELVVLATDKQPKTKLRKREKHYHAMFEKVRIEGQEEWFKLKDVVKYLKETNMLGNCSNTAEIEQYIKI